MIEPNKQFFIDEDATGPNIKVGIRFLSSATEISEVDEFALIFATEDNKLIKLNLT